MTPCPLLDCNLTPRDTNHLGNDFYSLQIKDDNLAKSLLQKYPDKVKGIAVIFACQWERLKANRESAANHFMVKFKECNGLRPLSR